MTKKPILTVLLLVVCAAVVLGVIWAVRQQSPTTDSSPSTSEPVGGSSSMEPALTYVDPILNMTTTTSSGIGLSVLNAEKYAQMDYEELVQLSVERCASLPKASGIDKDVLVIPDQGLAQYSYVSDTGAYVSFSLPYKSAKVIEACKSTGISDDLVRISANAEKQHVDDCRSMREEIKGKSPDNVLPSGVTVKRVQTILAEYCTDVQ